MRICLISMTAIEDDPRVRRQGDALADAGHEVVAVGIPGARSSSPTWPVQHVSGRKRSMWRNVDMAMRVSLASALPRLAEQVYWSFTYNRTFLEAALSVNADLYLANDWWVLPIAQRAASSRRVEFAYDTHEYAVEENAGKTTWNLVFPRYIDRIERAGISNALAVTTVAPGIADLLRDRYSLKTLPTVIRNVPALQEVPHHDVTVPYTVLYQGMFNPDRRLDVLINSVASWRDEFRLVLRGDGAPSQLDLLHKAARSLGDRVRIEPPVPMTEMVQNAATADIGIHPIPMSNPQARYCLPNKLFEYAMAGLAVCVSDVPEMRRVIDKYEYGVTINSTTGDGIAAAVNSLDADLIVKFRAKARVAARELNWGVEMSKLLGVIQ